MKKNNNSLLIVLLIILGIFSRLLPHPANFTPLAAIALFSGLYLPHKRFIFLPLIAMLISDLFIGLYHPAIMASVYLGFLFSGLIGYHLRTRKTILNIGLGTITGSLSFFFLTNLAVWFWGNLYPLSFAGLSQCFVLAVPFFRHTLAGDLFYTTILVGGFEFFLAYQQKKKLAVNQSSFSS
ncbi:MAG TPA: DUF6580 family putative transport protein [Patescibacteria group bacterium]|nr:DUF6580 family putative transport protein [Patescibacteria group bacterium]